MMTNPGDMVNHLIGSSTTALLSGWPKSYHQEHGPDRLKAASLKFEFINCR